MPTADNRDVAILFALREEFDVFYNQLRSRLSVAKDDATGQYDYLFEHPIAGPGNPYRCVTSFVGEIGATPTAVTVRRIVRKWEPQTVVLIGIAGGMNNDVRLGDVVVATSVDGYMERAKAVASSDIQTSQSPGESTAFELKPGGETFRTTSVLVRLIQNLRYAHPKLYEKWRGDCRKYHKAAMSGDKGEELKGEGLMADEPEIVLGHIASGPVVSSSTAFRDWLLARDRNFLCIEMEAVGLLSAIYDEINSRSTLVVRGISDLADSRKSRLDEIGKGQIRRTAVRNAIALVRVLLETGEFPRSSSAGLLASTPADAFADSYRTSHQRCVARWESIGVPPSLAQDLADDRTVGILARDQEAEVGRIKIILAPMGAGKSLAADRLFQESIIRAKTDGSGAVPIYLAAQQLGVGSLEDLVRERTSAFGGVQARGVDLVVDGLDELPYKTAVDVISQARAFARTWSNTRVHCFSRCVPMLLSEGERGVIPELTDEQAGSLITRISGRSFYPYGDVWPASIRKAVVRPFFAVLFGIWRRGQDANIPRSSADLMESLVSRAMRSIGKDAKTLDDLLRRTAIAYLDSNSGIVLRRDFPITYQEVDVLTQTGLVEVEGDARCYTFASHIVAQWFGAQAIIKGEVAASDVVAAPSRLERWNDALIIAVGTGSHDDAARILHPLAEHNPAIAAKIVEEAVAGWACEDIPAPPAHQCGRQLREAMSIWASGVGPLAQLIAPITKDGGIQPIGVRTDNSMLVAGWYSGPATGADVLDLPTGANLLSFKAGWNSMRSARPGNSPAWAFRWTLEECVGKLSKLLQSRSLDVDSGPLDVERRWRLLLDCTRTLRVNCDGEYLCLHDLCAKLEGIGADRANVYLPTTGGDISASAVLQTLYELTKAGTRSLHAPWPGPDVSNRGRYVWSNYSREQLLRRVTAVFSAAVEGYQQLVERYFAKFAARLWTYAMLPARFVGLLFTDNEPSLHWYLDPAPRGQATTVDVSLAMGLHDDLFPEELGGRLVRTIGALRSDCGSWLRPRFSSEILMLFGTTPATDITYKWLRSDLAAVSWASRL